MGNQRFKLGTIHGHTRHYRGNIEEKCCGQTITQNNILLLSTNRRDGLKTDSFVGLRFPQQWEFYLLEYSALLSVESQLAFRRNMSQMLATCWFLLGLFFYPENGGYVFMRNVG